jgi:hypothetical protein
MASAGCGIKSLGRESCAKRETSDRQSFRAGLGARARTRPSIPYHGGPKVRIHPPLPTDATHHSSSRSYAVTDLVRLIQTFSRGDAGSAPTYTRECDLRAITGGPRRSSRDELWRRLGETRTGAWVHSAATPVAGFFAACRSGDHSYVIGSGSMPAVTALMRPGSRGRRGGVVSRKTAGKYRKARPSLMLER